MSSNNREVEAARGPALGAADREVLKDVAHRAVRHGLAHGQPPGIDMSAYPAALHAVRSSFVTLKISGDLRGCVGSLEARYPLVEDVANNAFAAAFRDPRFAPLGEHEYRHIGISISLLSPAEAMPCACEAELIAALQPGVDGLILEDGEGHRATFLPAVWQTLERPEEFIRQLKVKAGLAPHYWSATLRIRRYTTEHIS